MSGPLHEGGRKPGVARHPGFAALTGIIALAALLAGGASLASCGGGTVAEVAFTVRVMGRPAATPGSKLLLPNVDHVEAFLRPLAAGLSEERSYSIVLDSGDTSVYFSFPETIIGPYELEAIAYDGSDVPVFSRVVSFIAGEQPANLLMTPEVFYILAPETDTPSLTVAAGDCETFSLGPDSVLLGGARVRASGGCYIYIQTAGGRLVAYSESPRPDGLCFLDPATLPPGEDLFLTLYNPGSSAVTSVVRAAYSITYVIGGDNQRPGAVAPRDPGFYAMGEPVGFASDAPSMPGGAEVVAGSGVRQAPRWHFEGDFTSPVAFPFAMPAANLRLHDYTYTSDGATVGKIGPGGGWIFAAIPGGGTTYFEMAPYDLAPLEREAAIAACDYLQLNGFDDWHLPGYDEINTIHANLVDAGIGNIRAVLWLYYVSTGNGSMYRFCFLDAGSWNDQTSGWVRPVRSYLVP